MSCCHPYKGFRTGYLTENGRDEIVLFRYSQCDEVSLSVISKKAKINIENVPHKVVSGEVFLTEPIDIPCGCCIGCRMAKAKEWKIRNCLESSYHGSDQHFITLTYDDEHLPINEFGEPYLKKDDLSLFMRYIRRNCGDFRFFGCGEYGENTQRPHFHLLLYGRLNGFSLIGVNKFSCKDVDKAWSKGNAIVEAVTPGSIAYVSGYCVKKQRDPYFESYPVKPFINMSRKPGIGFQWVLDHMDTIRDTFKVSGYFGGSKPSSVAIPRGWKRKLEDEPFFEEWKEASKLAGETIQETMMAVYHCCTKERLGDAVERSLLNNLDNLTRKESL